MKIYNAEEAFIVTLERYPIAQGTEIISQMNVTGRLRATEDSFHSNLRTYEQDPDGNRHHHAKDDAKHARKHCQNQENETKTLDRLEARFKAGRQNALQNLAPVEGRYRN